MDFITNKRYIGALVISPFILILLIGGTFLNIAILVLAFIGLNEFINAIGNKQNVAPKVILNVFLGLLLAWESKELDFIYLYAILNVIFLIIPLFSKRYTFVDLSISSLGFFYVGILFKVLYLLANSNTGHSLILFAFALSCGSDTIAYYSGRFLGKHKLSPSVSPNKTIEGSIGGLLGAVLVSYLFCNIILSTQYSFAPSSFIWIGLLCGILCQMGDLVASAIKRNFGIKDYSNLIPGHGGVLDRFDSVLFSSLGLWVIFNILNVF